MATFGYLIPREQAIIDLINALKIEIDTNSDTHKVNPENYEVWHSIQENASLLLDLCKLHVCDKTHYRGSH